MKNSKKIIEIKSLAKADKSSQDESRNFLRRSVKINEFIIRYTPESCDTLTEEYAFWKAHVVPSCVPEGDGSKFKCVFCGRKISSACGIRRHYMEQHYEYIPEGIFGSQIIIECVECHITFSRQAHLTSHLLSELHLKNVRLLEVQRVEENLDVNLCRKPSYKHLKTIFFANSLIEENKVNEKQESGQQSDEKQEDQQADEDQQANVSERETSLDSGYASLEKTYELIPRTSTQLSTSSLEKKTNFRTLDASFIKVRDGNTNDKNFFENSKIMTRCKSELFCYIKNKEKNLEKTLSDSFNHNVTI